MADTGRKYLEKYKDIINIKRPKLKHIPMDVAKRAKQFAPFSALKGLDESIDTEAKTRNRED